MRNSYFLSQPHQPFFILGFVNFITAMLIFMLSFKGVFLLSVDSLFFHGFSLIFLSFTPVFLGFVFTTFPRFCQTSVIENSRYQNIFFLFVLSSLLFYLGAFTTPFISTLSLITMLGAFSWAVITLLAIYKTSTIADKHDPFWILSGFGFGLLSLVVFILGFKDIAVQVGIYLYLFIVVFSVGQRMIPFFSHLMFEKKENFLKIVVGLLLIRVVSESIYANSAILIDLALAFIIGSELRRWKVPFSHPDLLLRILHIALLWIPVAFLLSAIASTSELFLDISTLKLGIHALMLGFLLTVLIGFGTRVTLGHSGNMMRLNQVTIYLFYFTQVVVLFRILTSLIASFGFDFMMSFDISMLAWFVLFGSWAFIYFKVLIFGVKLK